MPSSEDIIDRSFLGDLGMKQSVTEEITIRRARSIADYLFLRTLRNQVRQSMTNDTGLVTLLQQAHFFLAKPAAIDIYIAFAGSNRAGYLLLRRCGGTTFITEAVEARFRRNRIAARMVRFAQDLCTDITAEIRSDNAASITLHLDADFVRSNTAGEIQIFRFMR